MSANALPHRYAAIARLVEALEVGAGHRVELNDGTSFLLPESGYHDFNKLRKDDLVLIDLHEWGDAHKLAHVFVYRRVQRNYPPTEATRFSIGEMCQLVVPTDQEPTV